MKLLDDIKAEWEAQEEERQIEKEEEEADV